MSYSLFQGCPRKTLGGSCDSRKLFRNAADATAHIENGGCGQGRARGRDEVYEFMKSQAPHLMNRLAIGYDSEGGSRPEYPFKCQYCDKLFKLASSMTRHAADKHGNSF